MDRELPVTLSVFDRLIQLRPKETTQGYESSVDRAKRAILRDLEWLLNTPYMTEDLSPAFHELRKSLYSYGFLDFTSLGWDSSTDDRLAQAIESAITTFEPRLEGVSVTPRSEGKERARQFLVKAFLRLEPTLRGIVFDTVVDLNLSTRKFAVLGH